MEIKGEGRRGEEGWLLVQWISEDDKVLLKTDEKNAWQLLSLSLSLCVFLSPLSLSTLLPAFQSATLWDLHVILRLDRLYLKSLPN